MYLVKLLNNIRKRHWPLIRMIGATLLQPHSEEHLVYEMEV